MKARLTAAGFLCLSQVVLQAADKAEVLFDGRNLDGWRKPTGTWMAVRSVVPGRGEPEHFTVIPGQGVLVNSATNHTVDLITDAEFGDVEAHIEFCIARHSNSGVYLMGRYELQIYDSYGVEKDKYPGIECGGIYPRWIDDKNVDGHSPLVNASKPAGAWQSFENKLPIRNK